MEEQFKKLTQQAGFCQLPGRTQIELTGDDRAGFLHGLCTNDIRCLEPGTGCEAFLTNVQGKTAGYVYVFCTADSLWLDTVSGEAAAIVEGLDKYLVREDVVIHDRSAERTEFIVAGELAAEWLHEQLGWQPPSRPLDHVIVDGDMDASLKKVPYGGPTSFFLSGPTTHAAAWQQKLLDAGMLDCQPSTIERLRIEAGSPIYGVDLNTDNLPQEVGRDREAIHFNKGCYLGQETVARLDALGHVNRRLVCLQFEGEAVPTAGLVLQHEGKPLARITSACWSCTLKRPIALGYVRRSHMEVGSHFKSELGIAEVIAPPRAG